MKSALKSLFRRFGLDLRRVPPPPAPPPAPGTPARPVGEMKSILEDLKARGFRPRGLLDVGAHRGDWTLMAREIFPQLPSLMIEPQEEMKPTLTELCARHPDCRWVQAGAGATAGELVQTVWDDLAGSSFLPATQPELLAAGRQRKTRIVAIDDLLRTEQRAFEPDLVKLDIQGFELEALRGGRSLFGRTEVFVIEASLFRFLPAQPLAREIIAFLGENGYELYDLASWLRRPRDGALGQVDFVFVKARGMFRASDAW